MLPVKTYHKSKKYIFISMFNWIKDNNQNPYLMINTNLDGVVVPDIFMKNKDAILNLSELSIDLIEFNNNSMRFSYVINSDINTLCIPYESIISIFDPENGMGMSFKKEVFSGVEVERVILIEKDEPCNIKKNKPELTIIK